MRIEAEGCECLVGFKVSLAQKPKMKMEMERPQDSNNKKAESERTDLARNYYD
jgi:hypothetical protein